eukprot:Phypoly_transcript_11591.p1 GENE.Phypoly_transcript_11591~~Phypoly_transcript_11591.p1  ORF type:complete len:361 (+),score=56.53 Phypoly_transcript_11591:82-1164(+)
MDSSVLFYYTNPLKLAQLKLQTTLDPHLVPRTQIPSQKPRTEPTPPGVFFDPAVIRKNWIPGASTPSPPPSSPLPSTRNWTIKERIFFKLHYVNVEHVDFPTVFCPEVAVPPVAQELINAQMGLSAFLAGEHLDHEHELIESFGDNIVAVFTPKHTEDATYDLAKILLKICNPNKKALFVSPKLPGIVTQVGSETFTSFPDCSVTARESNGLAGDPIAIVIGEDKQIGAGFGENQIPGEMVAVASKNFQRFGVAQTVFAIRIIQASVTLYRADFTKQYLESVVRGAPSEHITIFRLGGTDSDQRTGIRISDFGDGRAFVVNAISSIMNICATDIIPNMYGHSRVADTTQMRIDLLKDTFA